MSPKRLQFNRNQSDASLAVLDALNVIWLSPHVGGYYDPSSKTKFTYDEVNISPLGDGIFFRLLKGKWPYIEIAVLDDLGNYVYAGWLPDNPAAPGFDPMHHAIEDCYYNNHKIVSYSEYSDGSPRTLAGFSGTYYSHLFAKSFSPKR